MVIDVHVHPTGYSLISQDPEERKFRDKVFQRKYDESKLPIAMTGKPSGGNSGGSYEGDGIIIDGGNGGSSGGDSGNSGGSDGSGIIIFG